MIEPLTFSSIVHSPVTVSWLHLFGSHHLSLSFLIEPCIQLFFINDKALLHIFDKFYILNKNIPIYFKIDILLYI